MSADLVDRLIWHFALVCFVAGLTGYRWRTVLALSWLIDSFIQKFSWIVL